MIEQAEASSISIERLRKQYEDWAQAKTAEIEEQRIAWRYRHHAQWTDTQLRELAKRKQPAITFARVGRKIDGIVGVVRQLRGDPKAFARNPEDEPAAEVATQIVRFLCDSADFESVEAEVVEQAAFHGIGVAEKTLIPVIEGGVETGDYDSGLVSIDARTFFYDPRSLKPDFSDVRHCGVAKWVSLEELDEIYPGASAKVSDLAGGGFNSSAHDADVEHLWTDAKGRARLVDHWYISQGKWMWCVHVGATKLDAGESPFFDEKGRSVCKYQAFSCAVDQDGDRYGFPRVLKGPQDAINQHRSKAMHIMNTRQVKVRRGSQKDIEKLRREAARPDGVLEYDGNPNDFEVLQPAQEFLQQTQYFQDAKDEIENFGPNPALIGTGVKSQSGRAISMMRQAGLAEIGPFLGAYRKWKLRVYRLFWEDARRYMKAERWVRVTDDEQAQYLVVNQSDPIGMSAPVNQIAQMNMDIVLDEGPDTETVLGDTNDTIQALAQSGAQVPPQVLIELSPLPASVKKKLLEMMQPPPPDPAQQQAAQQAEQVQLERAVAEIDVKRAQAGKMAAEAKKTEQDSALSSLAAQRQIALEAQMSQMQGL